MKRKTKTNFRFRPEKKPISKGFKVILSSVLLFLGIFLVWIIFENLTLSGLELFSRTTLERIFPTAQASITKQINYQGKLTNSSSWAVPDASYDMRFKIYDAVTDGSLLWTGTHTGANGNAVAVANGIFSVQLGSGAGNTLGLDFAGANGYWLQVEIYNSDTTLWETFSPRKAMVSVPQAINANNVIGDGRIDIAYTDNSNTALKVTQSGTGDIVNILDGATEVFTILDGGNAGIGTTGPDRRLDVLDASNPQLRLTQADGTVYSDFQMTSGGDMVMNVDGVSNQLVLDNGGDVGIGTASPYRKFEVNGEFGVGDTTQEGVILTAGATGTAGYIIGVDVDSSGYNDLNLRAGAAGTGVYIKTDGNVGIATTGPDRKLDVLDASNPQLRLTQADGTVYTDLQTTSDGYLYLNPSGNRVGIGNSAPGNMLDVGSATAGGNAAVNATVGSELAPALTNGNWTLGAGWQHLTTPDRLDKNADGTGTVTPSAATNIVAGTTYKVVITVDSISGSTATYTLGGVRGNNLTAATTYTNYITAASTGKLIITPVATGLRITISSISIKALTDNTGDLAIGGNLTVRSASTFNGPINVSPGESTNFAISFETGTYKTGIYEEYPGTNVASLVFFGGGTQQVLIGNGGIASNGFRRLSADTTFDVQADPGTNATGMRVRYTGNKSGASGTFQLLGLGESATMTGTGGSYRQLAITPTYNQTSGTASNTDLFINRTETALGSGAQYLIDAQAGTITKFSITNNGQGYFSDSLGVNTTGPDRKLDVLDASNPQLRLTQADGTAWVDLQADSSSNLTIAPNGGDVMLSNAATELKIKESTGDTYYGIFDVADLGEDRTYTLPNVSGTVVTTGDTGSVTTTMLANDSILEVDLNVTNDPADNQILSYDLASGGFTWVDASGVTDIWVDTAGDTMTGGLIFSGVATDITSVSNQDIVISPNGTGKVGIANGSPGYTLDVGGDINTGSANEYRIGGTQVLSKGNGSLTGNLIVGDGGGSLTHAADDEGYYNTVVGLSSGSALTTGYGNTFLGNQTGNATTTGLYNVGIGINALNINTEGDNNIAIGGGTLASNLTGDYNIAIGGGSLIYNTASENIGIGYAAGSSTTSGTTNIYMGTNAGLYNQTGSSNVVIGPAAGMGVTENSYSNNTLIGHMSGYGTTTGGNNVMFGYQSGYTNATGAGNVFLGYQAGYSETGSNKLYIDNSNTASPLIYGDFSTDAVTVNGSLTVSGANDLTLNNASSELKILESTGGTYYGIIDVGDLGAADAAYTFSGVSGTVWTSGNDGSGSGVDADTLDGHDTGYFMTAGTDSWINSNGDTGTGNYDFTAAFFQGASPFVFEGTSADDYETIFTITNPTTIDKTITFPNITGTVVTTGDTGSVTGAMIQNDTVNLPTDTTGNYVASITNGSGISGGNGGSEGSALTLALGALTAEWLQSGAYDITLSNASSELRIKESTGDTYYGVLEVGDLASADATYTFSGVSGTVVTTTNEAVFTGAGRHTRALEFKPEYAGAVLTKFYGGGTETVYTGTMTSDTEGSNPLHNYYSWTSAETAALNSYAVSFTTALPSDFDSWAASNAIQVAYKTTTASDADQEVEVYIYDSTGTLVASSTSSNASTSWTTVNIDDSSLAGWATANSSAFVYVRMRAKSSNVVKAGEIKLNYLSKW